VTLNEDGTRLLRAFRDDTGASADAGTARRSEDTTTTELRIPPGELQ
jgi:hypothetical protein